jgi:hypothetical protein
MPDPSHARPSEHYLADGPRGGLLAASLGVGTERTAAAAGAPIPPLDAWLAEHDNIARAIAWDFGSGSMPYATWPNEFKERLRTAFARARNGEPSGLVDPAPNQTVLKDQDDHYTVLSSESAFALHAALVAHNLAQEISRSLPWSMMGYDDHALQALLNGTNSFVSQGRNFRMKFSCLPGPPEISLAFLKSRKILDKDGRATIVNMLAWCRDQLRWDFVNGYDHMPAKNAELCWHYRGSIPISRVLSGTTNFAASINKDQRRHWVSGNERDVNAVIVFAMRAANIPVQQIVSPWFNGTPHFMAEDLCLTSGPDVYDDLCRLQPSFPIDKILITKAQFDAWFPATAKPAPGVPPNVGRRVAELAVQYLPIELLHDHALDMISKIGKENGFVFKRLKSKYSVAELDLMQLWQRLDFRVRELGGPPKVVAMRQDAWSRLDRQSIAVTAQ